LGEVRRACNTGAGFLRSIRLLVMLGTTGAVGNGIIFMKNGAGRQRRSLQCDGESGPRNHSNEQNEFGLATPP
jgi:hypothetical protein